MTEPSEHEPFRTSARSRVHGKKLDAAIASTNYSAADRTRLEAARERYQQWVEELTSAGDDGTDKLAARIDALNAYKRYIELDLIWDSEDLYRSKGQHKIDNAVMEEFLPWLVDPDIVPGLKGTAIEARSAAAFAAMGISSTLATAGTGTPGLDFRRKDQDFAVGRELHLRASFDTGFPPGTTESHSIFIGYVAAECKTNLDKTMFQEATTTARDLKVAIPASKYVLICEYLDMAPVNHHATDIVEVLILRGARMGADQRKTFGKAAGRVAARDGFERWLVANPIRREPLDVLVRVITESLGASTPTKAAAIAQGHF